MFWHLLLGLVIGGQLCRVPPISAEWEEKKVFFDEKTERIWPSAELSARAKYTREHVVEQCWTSFVEDKFDLDNAILAKAEFSCAIAVMDRIGGWEEGEGEQENGGGCKIRCKHFHLHQSRSVQRTEPDAKYHSG